MTAARVRRWLALLALGLGLGAAVAGTTAPAHRPSTTTTPLYKPPSGC